ncbi:MAG: hypothetical protein J0L58_14040 [Burkholderiales bacterium]|nr:hypothetical protein [Burkholderiales bacterium]
MQDRAPWLHSSFYRFSPLADPVAVAAHLRELARALAPGLLGSIVLAPEGISAALAASPDELAAFELALQRSGHFGDAPLVFKHSAGRTPPFGRLKVSVKPEIVALDFPHAADLPPPDEHDDSHLSPAAWRALLDREDVVLLDNRNHFEWRLGRFRGAIDPGVQHFRDFVAFVETQAPQWRAEHKTVAMYCTGGVRCDKTAPWMRSLGLTVLQLDGGILNHLQSMPDAERDWEGECYVFDKRIALDARLQETATEAGAVFDPSLPDEAWRLERARRLDES